MEAWRAGEGFRACFAAAWVAASLLAGCVSEEGTPEPDAGTDAAGTSDSGGIDAPTDPDSGNPDDAAQADGGDGGASTDGSVSGDAGSSSCDEGYVRRGTACVRDKCIGVTGEPALCGPNGQCSRGTSSSPECECDEGYVEEDLQCVRNPCVTLDGEPAHCHADATCAYEGEGIATCACNEGYEGDGHFSCVRNACVQLDGEDPPCSAHEVCAPTTPGEKSCSCEDGFFDCDVDVAGCEVELATDADHCGACGNVCALGLTCELSRCASRFASLSLGYSGTIGALPDGTILGAGVASVLGQAASSVFVMTAFPDATAVTAATSHACLVREDGLGGTCWGSNASYQLGSFNVSDTSYELPLLDLSAISAGATHTCVLRTNGLVYCFGSGTYGQQGDGAASPDRSLPDVVAGSGRPVEDVTGAVAIAAGDRISCALNDAHRVHCWGAVGTTVYAPELVADEDGIPLDDAEEICVGIDFGCARRDDATVVCWGSDGFGQLGSDDTPAGRSRYVGVPLAGARGIACGALHACAVVSGSTVSCWGFGTAGQLGRGSAMSSPLPVPFLLPPDARARAVYSGSQAAGTCVELTTGEILCAGNNSNGQLGNGTTGAGVNSTPFPVTSWP